MMDDAHLSAFEASRRYLFGLAYRILGSRAEAEDAVQDLYLKWREADPAAIAEPRAWLTTACTRHCIDQLRAARRSRVDYIGTWLPEPIHTTTDDTPESALALASSLSTAFLLVLERLNPKERAAYLLHEIFEVGYADIATALGMQETACRKLVSRARERVGSDQARPPPPPDRQEALLGAFRSAITSGSTDTLSALLAEDAVLSTDGGGKVSAVRVPLYGRSAVLDFVERALTVYWRTYTWVPAQINGSLGALVYDGDALAASLSFDTAPDGRIRQIYIVRNPDKLARLGDDPAALL